MLYLISEKDDLSKDILIEKYKPLILSTINKMNLDKNEKEDYYQEGLLCLIKAINTYNDNFKFSFNSYFSLILKRRFIDLLRKKQRSKSIIFSDIIDEFVIDSSTMVEEKTDYSLNYKTKKLSPFEQTVYHMKYAEGLKPGKIAVKLNVEVKTIYDALSRIKRKISKNQ